MKPTAIILARGGSKGLPAKNLRPICGRACVEWTFDAALASTRLKRVLFSSDSAQLLAIARSRNIETHIRSAALAGDMATIDAAAREALASDPLADPIVILYGNVPIRPPNLIDDALILLERTRCDSVQSVAPVGRHHPWWMARIDDHQRLTPWQGDTLNNNVFRRQDLPPAYMPDGGIIALRRDALEHRIQAVAPGPHAFLGLDRRAIINPHNSVIDIDTETDLQLASVILEAAHRSVA